MSSDRMRKNIVTHYDMNKRKRGMAVIFNHKNYKPDGETVNRARNGTEVDCNRLETCLKGLGFTVIIYQDETFVQIYHILEKLSQQNHSENDCFLLAVLTHGTKGKLFAYDREYNYEELWRPFYSSHCPTLMGKPKLFIIQACQGILLDDGFSFDDPASCLNNIETCSVMNVPNKKIDYFAFKPLGEPDFLIAFSTPPDYYSWRNTTNGSWLIQELCKQLETNVYKYHLLELLTLVCNSVAMNYESYNPDQPDFHKKKQVPFISHTLLKLCCFTKKEKTTAFKQIFKS